MKTDFEKFALSQGIGTLNLHRYNQAIAPMAGYINPTILEERELNVVGYDIFSRLMVDRIIFLGTAVTEDSGNIVASQLMYLNSCGEDDIKMFLNTPGGVISDGLMIVDVMNYIKPDVATYCLGTAASMGSIILSSGTKGKRHILPHGEVMIHQPSGGFGQAKSSDIEIYNNHIQKYKNDLYKILSERTGQPFEKIREDAERDKWFDADGAIEYGLVDEKIKSLKEV